MPSSSGLPGRPHTSSRLARSPERAAALARIEVICGRRSLPRPGRSAGSLSSGIPDGLVGHEGRLHVDKDVPARLAVVLSRSNRVLTLRRILHAQPQISAAQADGSRRVEDSMHPILVAALAEDQHRRCPCGAVTQQPYRLCHGCRPDSAWRCRTVRRPPSRRSPSERTPIPKARPFARVLSLLQSISKGAEG